MDLAELIAGLGLRRIGPGEPEWGAVRVCDITEDSRTVVPGSLFVARGGLKADGKAYVREAVRAGAVAIVTDAGSVPAEWRLPAGCVVLHAPDVERAAGRLAERFYGSPSGSLQSAMVTGTNGKTTIAYLIWQLLNGAGKRCGLVGTVVIDDGAEVAPATMTTPPAIELSRTLAMMREGGCEAVAMEASSHALHQHRLDAIRVGVAVFTNLTGDHLDYHGSMEAYADAKARLFELVGAEGTAVVNVDDPGSARMVRDCRARVWECSGRAERRAGCQVDVLGMGLDGMDVRLRGPWGQIECRVGLIGRYNAMNILQSVAAAHAMGLSEGSLREGLARLAAPPGRLERVSKGGDDIHVFVDYAHTDDALASVLVAAGEVVPGRGARGQSLLSAAGSADHSALSGRLWVVFGCGGERDASKRPRMGRVAAELADVVVVTSDNPRTEQPGTIIDQILAGVAPEHRAKVSVQADRARAIQDAIERARAGDVVVIAGKGHETEQILPDGQGGVVRVRFDDREVADAALAARRPAPVPRAREAARGEVRARVPGARGASAGRFGRREKGRPG